jgi:hypothetical protein
MSGEQVVLIPQSVNGGPVQWTMVHDGSVGNGGNYPPIKLPDGGPKDDITFTIVDINGLGIKFDPAIIDASSKPKAINAIWIVEGSGSQKKAGAYPAEFDKVSIQGNGQQLVVSDKNSNGDVYTYQLNFVGSDPTQKITSIDPEIRNGGGTKAQLFSLETAAVLLSAAVLLLVAVQAFGYFRARKT